MNANIKKRHIFHEMKYDLKCHKKLQKLIFVFNINFFVDIFFV